MMKNALVAATALSAVSTLAVGSTGTSAVLADKPNIVLFFVDDWGWNCAGYHNPELFETPNIDQLAQDGIDFQQAYIASPSCSPSRAALMTGKHPVRLRMVRHITENTKVVDLIKNEEGEVTHTLWKTDPAHFPSINYLGLEYTTYAEALKKQGYYNLFLGKWHLGGEAYYPVKQGFDRQIGTTEHGAPSNYYPDYFKDSDVFAKETEQYLTDKLTDETVQFIDEYDRDQPFMISLCYYGVHTPNIGRKDLVKKAQAMGHEGKRAHMVAQVMAVDESVGRVRAALKAKGLDKNTIIVMSSDQGSLYEWEPYRGGKRVDTLCEGGARVPFIVSWPGVADAGVQNDSIIQTTDLFPTLVEMTGGDLSDYEYDGMSLVKTIKENSTLKRGKPVFGYRAYEDQYVSVREGDWKLLAYRSGKILLYNMESDRVEKNDLATMYPEKVQELTAELKAWEKELGVQKYSGVQ